MGKKDLDPRNWGNGKAEDLGKVDLGPSPKGPDVRPDASGPAKPAQSKAQTVLDDTKSTKERQTAMRSQVKESDNAVRQMLRDMGGTPSTDKIVVGSPKASPSKVQSKPAASPARTSGNGRSNSSVLPSSSSPTRGSSATPVSGGPKPPASSSKPVGGIGIGTGPFAPPKGPKPVAKPATGGKGSGSPRSTGTSKAEPYTLATKMQADLDKRRSAEAMGARSRSSGTTSIGNQTEEDKQASRFKAKVEAPMAATAGKVTSWLNKPLFTPGKVTPGKKLGADPSAAKLAASKSKKKKK